MPSNNLQKGEKYMSKANENVKKAMKRIEKIMPYIKQNEAVGFKLPQAQMDMIYDIIQRDKEGRGMSTSTLENFLKITTMPQLKSRMTFDPSLTINGLGKATLVKKSRVGGFRLQDKASLQEFSDKVNELLNDYLDNIDFNHYKNAAPTIMAKTFIKEVETLGFDINNLDFTQLASGTPEALKYGMLLKDIERLFSSAPMHISPFRDELYKKMGQKSHVKFLSNMGFSDRDISLFEQYIDSSQFWNMIHKSNYASSQETGQHEIRDVVSRLKEAMFDPDFDEDDFMKLQEMLRNKNNYRAIDGWVKRKITMMNKKKEKEKAKV